MFDGEVPSIFMYFPVEQNIWKDRYFMFVPPTQISALKFSDGLYYVSKCHMVENVLINIFIINDIVIINLVNKSIGTLTVKLM
jgi:hypothetical protein